MFLSAFLSNESSCDLFGGLTPQGGNKLTDGRV